MAQEKGSVGEEPARTFFSQGRYQTIDVLDADKTVIAGVFTLEDTTCDCFLKRSEQALQGDLDAIDDYIDAVNNECEGQSWYLGIFRTRPSAARLEALQRHDFGIFWANTRTTK